ncbi:MAG: metallophosphoesterase [Gemmatimonadota bacterium]
MLSRRAFVAGSVSAGAFVSTVAWARWGELHRLEFVEHDLPIGDLPSTLDGQLVVQLSDLHIGPQVAESFLLDAFELVKALDPAFVAYTGDFVTYESRAQLFRTSDVMRNAPHGRIGTLSVLGNHDYGHAWADRTVAAEIARRVEDCGITVLRNSSRIVSGLQFTGFDDLLSPAFGGATVMARRERGVPTIALCHNPDACDLDVWDDFGGWVLAGHTHGGQVSLPIVGPPILPVRNRRYAAGEYELAGGRRLYINRALGHTFPVRLGVRPEITLHRLIRV